MTRWLAAARQAQRGGTQRTQPTEPQLQEVSSVVSVLSEGAAAVAASVANPKAERRRTFFDTEIDAQVSQHSATEVVVFKCALDTYRWIAVSKWGKGSSTTTPLGV